MDNWEMKRWIRELDIVEVNNYWTMKVGVIVELWICCAVGCDKVELNFNS